MKKILAIVLVLCSLISMSTLPAFASTDAQSTVPDDYKWDFGYNAETGAATESNGGKHCLIQRHTGYIYHAQNGCDCGNTDEVKHFAPFNLVAYSNGYHTGHDAGYIDKYVPMVQTENIWTFGDSVDLAGDDRVTAADGMSYKLCSSVDRGIIFTAPVAGDIKFDFYFKSTSTKKADLLIGRKASMRETCDNWSGDWDSSSCIEYISGSIASGLASTIITVEAGEEIVFLLHSNREDNVLANFFFDTVEYTEVFEEVPDKYKWQIGSHFTNANDNSLVEHDTAPFNLISYYAGGNPTWNTNGLTQGEHDMFKGEQGKYTELQFTTEDPNGPHMYHAVYRNGSGVQAVDYKQRLAMFIDGNKQVFDAQTQIDVGVSFIAPVTGKVHFNYKFDKVNDSDAVVLIIGRANDMTCDSQTAEWSDYERRVTADGRYFISLDVTAGEKIYFLVHSEANWTDTDRVAFHFDSVRYTSIDINEGVKVTNAQYKAEGQNYAVRFIATVDSLDYDEIGFLIEADDGHMTKSYDKHCTEVFDSLLALDGDNEVTHDAIDFNGRYLMTMTLGDIPTDGSGNATFRVYAYYVQNGQPTVTQEAAIFTTVNGVLQNP